MPKTRPPLAQRLVSTDAKRIRNDILGAMQDVGITKYQLAEAIGISKNTLLRKLKTPEKFTLSELMLIEQVLERNQRDYQGV